MVTKNKLSLPVLGNSNKAPNAQDYECPIWDRLDPDTKRAMNKLRDAAKGKK